VPFLRVDLADPVDPERKRKLLVRTAELFAEVVGSPLERVRTQVVELPADGVAVGGVPVAESGQQAPFIWIELLAGRPADRHEALIERQTALVASILGIPPDHVRVRITEVPPRLWGSAGRPATGAPSR
jgi:4-oxalocrotonate tautomerase family enzyme